MKEGKFIVVSGPSGSGKTTLVKALLSENLPLSFSISATSRQPRGDEVNGVDYYFLSAIEFKNHIKQEAFIEYEEVYKNTFYGTLKSEVERNWESERHVIFDVDVIGGQTLKSVFKDQALAIFVMPPSVEELAKRLNKRGTDSQGQILQRIGKASRELEAAEAFDVEIVNDDLEKANAETLKVVSEFLG